MALTFEEACATYEKEKNNITTDHTFTTERIEKIFGLKLNTSICRKCSRWYKCPVNFLNTASCNYFTTA